VLCFDVLLDERFQQRIGHAEAAAGVQHLFGEEVAVVAVQVANSPGGFGHDVKGGDGGGGYGR
jgi:hypothetical protein